MTLMRIIDVQRVTLNIIVKSLIPPSSSELEHALRHSLLDQRDRRSKSGGGGAGRQVINPS